MQQGKDHNEVAVQVVEGGLFRQKWGLKCSLGCKMTTFGWRKCCPIVVIAAGCRLQATSAEGNPCRMPHVRHPAHAADLRNPHFLHYVKQKFLTLHFA